MGYIMKIQKNIIQLNPEEIKKPFGVISINYVR